MKESQLKIWSAASLAMLSPITRTVIATSTWLLLGHYGNILCLRFRELPDEFEWVCCVQGTLVSLRPVSQTASARLESSSCVLSDQPESDLSGVKQLCSQKANEAV